MATRALADGHGCHGLGDTLLHRSDPAGAHVSDRALRDAVEADLSRLYAGALDIIRRRRERIADAVLARRFLTGEEIAELLSPSGAHARAPRMRGRNA